MANDRLTNIAILSIEESRIDLELFVDELDVNHNNRRINFINILYCRLTFYRLLFT